MKKKLGLFLAVILVQIAPFISAADASHPLVYKIDIKKRSATPRACILATVWRKPTLWAADAVLIHMNTYGGQVGCG